MPIPSARCAPRRPAARRRTPLLEAVRANHVTTAMALFEAGAVLGLVDATDSDAENSDLLAGGEMCQACPRPALPARGVQPARTPLARCTAPNTAN